ncbi:MAG: tetratricopeptide repeat protein, partial [Lysobacteraceae bacterium]
HHPLAIDLLRSRCAIERATGALEAAEADCSRALTLSVDLHGRGHPETLEARHTYAAVLADQGRFALAEATYRMARDWLVARHGPLADSVAGVDARIGRLAWERGDLGGARAALDRALNARRAQQRAIPLAAALADKAALLHATGDDARARALLVEARALRVRAAGPRDPLVGDTDRLLGEVDAALGNLGQARAELEDAVRMVRAGDGAAHPRTRRAELALATLQARQGEAAGLAALDALARLPQRDPQLRDIAWLADAQAAALRCGGPARARSLDELQALQAAVRIALPEGGIVAREIEALRAGCA